jgi:hypothetical protein
MQGGSEVTLSAHATLTSTTTKQVWARPPIDVDFQVLMFTASGLIVRFLKVFEKSNYQSVKWVRYLTKASGSYQVRVSILFYPWKTKNRIVLINTIDIVLRHIYMHVFHPQFHWIYLSTASCTIGRVPARPIVSLHPSSVIVSVITWSA